MTAITNHGAWCPKGKNYDLASAEEAQCQSALCKVIAAMIRSEAFELDVHVVEVAKSADEGKWFRVEARLTAMQRQQIASGDP